MKKVVLLVCLMALAIGASAQQLVDFTGLPASGMPTPLGLNYDNMSWSGIDSVDGLIYPDAGPGFRTGPEAMVAFGGGPLCFADYGGSRNDGVVDRHICESTIASGVGATAMNQFKADSAWVSAGWRSGSITVSAYNHGVQVLPVRTYALTTSGGKIVFPNWGNITELVIHPSPGGSFVLYTLSLK